MSIFETRRVRLRPWTMDDLEAFHSIWGDDRVIWWGDVTDLARSAGKLASCVQISDACGPDLGWFAVERPDGTVVGNVM
ncbi:MAG: GNAT family N-acetyltransferase, partial [Myxococcota bacterium]|nr:GNAT family N-acetyltransferase [Myxococcota bacterium]